MTTRGEELREGEGGGGGGGDGDGDGDGDGGPPQPPRTGAFLGKHRLSAAISRLEQEIQALQERRQVLHFLYTCVPNIGITGELNELETMEPSSAACKEVILGMEGKPDALLPVCSGPENASWDRWFQRVRSSHSRKWWTKSTDFS